MNIQLENTYKNRIRNRRSHPTTKAIGFPAFVVKLTKKIPDKEMRDFFFNGIISGLVKKGNVKAAKGVVKYISCQCRQSLEMESIERHI